MSDKELVRRKLLKQGVVWSTPIITSCLLPAHAATSEVPTTPPPTTTKKPPVTTTAKPTTTDCPEPVKVRPPKPGEVVKAQNIIVGCPEDS